ncbi:MAG: anaerobic ribonucleoside-triphosphate reductase activating protein [Bacilli bacterium]|jgi:anaerobic ribonucleoside-triphosphate reductase activating protein|nr:anaerobic ribonucleoside-triphosphate reductase activating protein [Bacilli bacterium]HHU24584.1 anaerobic ribonucleoside-triphosphate reductase activating protein [Acholeplasmataceae bacterium]
MKIRIAGVIKESIVDGPGIRFVVFTQGCPFNCPGCHNTNTHDFLGGKLIDIKTIIEDIKRQKMLRGLTISGGEPLMQTEACLEIVKGVKPFLTDIIVYTGFTWEEICNQLPTNPQLTELLHQIDYLIEGRYLETERDLSLKYRGSRNQRIIDVAKTLEIGKIFIKDFD